MRQQTIAEAVSCTGTGFRTGVPVRLNLLPAPPDTGVVFDPAESGSGPGARPANADLADAVFPMPDRPAAETLMAALFGLGIDNLRVEVDGPELPVMDGSAAPFVFLLRSAGVLAQPAARRVLRLRRPVEVRDGARRARIEPARSFRVDYAVDVEHPAVGRQEYRVDGFDPRHFERELAGARTFEFLRDVRSVWARGEAPGGSLDNTVVLDDVGVVNPDGLRWPDEFVRHRVLALFGHLGRLGVALQARVHIECGGRSLHRRLVDAIAATPAAWRIERRSSDAGVRTDLATAASA